MGVVYEASDRVVGRLVAYKRLLVTGQTSRAQATALFQREYNTLAQLAHPAIVEVYEYGNDELGPYYTMELLSGKDLLELAPMPVRDVCRVLRDVASALALVHARKLLHRDVSPGNVRLTDDGRAKLLDFGALTSFGLPPDLVGTPAFMAPEMLARVPLDQRADLYALGALAYWALTRKPVVRVRDLDGLHAAWAMPVERPSAYAEMPPALEALVLWLLNKDPASRPASAAEVIERLTAIGDLSPEPEEQKVAYSYLAHPPLVGRGDVLLRLEVALKQVADRQGGVVLLEAERGAGRSALLNHLGREAQLAGATVLRADASSDASSFGLARTLTRLGLALHPDLHDDARARDTHFAQLLGPQRTARGENAWSPLEASERQARTLSLMETILLDASEQNPTVILIDELHSADAESLALVASLAEEAVKHPLLLVVSASTGGSDSDAYDRIAARAQRVTLHKLGEADTVELVSSVFGGVSNSVRMARFLHEQSAGNPAHTMDLARLLLARGLIRYTRGTFTLPHDVGSEALGTEGDQVLLSRLIDLSPRAREIANLLAVSELSSELGFLADALSIEQREVVLAIEELRARGIVQLLDERAALTSAALQQAVQGSLEESVRRALHLKAARALLRAVDDGGDTRMQAGVHLLKAGEEVEAADLLTAHTGGNWLSGKTPIPLLETVLDVLRRQGRTDEQCLRALVPLVRGGFFGDMRAQRRHLDRTLHALSNVCGISSAVKLAPRFGAKLGLILGVLGAALRHAFTPKKYRFGSFKETISALLSILSASTAAAASAFDTVDAFRLARMFEPMRAFGEESAPYLTLEFCLATAEVGSGRFGDAIERYSRLLTRFERPVKGMNSDVHLQFRQGILHGLAQAKAVDARPEVLALADELERAHVFFAPHAEVIRASYHGQRGEQALSTQHRERGELLALRGGISWSSVTVMTMRALYMAQMSNDVVAIVRLVPELERLSEIAPAMLLFRDAANAYLELARGRPERAVAAYEALFAQPLSAFMPVHRGDRSMYARALCAVGRAEDARQICQSIVDSLPANETLSYVRAFSQQLAECELALDMPAAARARLEQLLALVDPSDNPLWSGLLHGDLARIALRTHDEDAYRLHERAMTRHFSATQNPALMQQVEQLHNEYALATLRPVAELLSRSALSDELDELSTAMETDELRIAQLSGHRERVLGDDHDELDDELGAADTVPPAKPLKQA